MDLGIAGRVALIAGGSRGSGLAIARRFAAEGVRVVLSGRDPSIVDQAVGAIRATGAEVVGVVADMSLAAGAAAMRSAAERAFGPPEILVINPPSPARTRGFLASPPQEFQDCFDAYVMPVVHLAQAILPGMQQRRWGRVVLLGSANMKNPNSVDPVITQNVRVAGAALIKTLTYEFSRDNITFNTFAIGAFHTDLAKAYLSEAPTDAYRTFADKVPLKRWAEPEELANAVAFVCSDAAGYINGELIRIDGGQTESLF